MPEMGYASLQACVADLEKTHQLRRIDVFLDPVLEIPYIQRRAFRSGGPALLFSRPKGCCFPMLANLFGTRERVNYIFRDSIERVKTVFEAKADIRETMRHPSRLMGILPGLWQMRPKHIAPAKAPVLACECKKDDLPRLVSWKEDGGAFITLPLVYSEDPESPGSSNLGMYRIQLDGNDYAPDECGMHYQLQRGICVHHAKSISHGVDLPVNVHVGGPPALTLAAIMPLPEGLSELIFAGLLGGRRVRLTAGSGLPVLADTDFVLECCLGSATKPEGPFGDHLGYYSLRHNFPVLKIRAIHRRADAIWPFTTVGRPPQEDSVFGDFIHEFTAPLVRNVFEGIKEINAVDAGGVHPLLLAVGSERYTPYEAAHKPRELLTLAMHLLGTTQTALAKYLLITSASDAPEPGCRDVRAFLMHLLERTDFSSDLHFFTNSACDTLDYSGYGLHEGSRLIWAAAGMKRRSLAAELEEFPDLPVGFRKPAIIMPGVLALEGPRHLAGRTGHDAAIQNELCAALGKWPQRDSFPLVVLVDDSGFCAQSFENFIWVTFTRSDPARDTYGPFASTNVKHWSCGAPLVIDGRLKSFQAAPLEDDPALVEYMETLAARGGALEGIF